MGAQAAVDGLDRLEQAALALDAVDLLAEQQRVLDRRGELGAGRAHEVDVVGRIGALGAGGDGHHAEQPALRLERGGEDRLEPLGAGQRERLAAGGDVFDHRRLLLAGDEAHDALLGGERRDGARVVVGDAAVQREVELVVGGQGDPAGVDLEDLDGLVEAGVQHRGEVERRVDRRHDGVQGDELLVAALDLVGELAGRTGVVGEPAARAGAQGDLAGRAQDERVALATVPDVDAVTVEFGLVGVEELAVHQPPIVA